LVAEAHSPPFLRRAVIQAHIYRKIPFTGTIGGTGFARGRPQNEGVLLPTCAVEFRDDNKI
jgi:hypothetical protein